MFLRYMEPDKKRNLTITISIILLVILAVFVWYGDTYTYKPGETYFWLSLTEYYSDREVSYQVDGDILSIDTRTVPTLSGSTEYYELTDEEIKAFSDYIVRKKRFFLNLDNLMTADEPNEITKKHTDRPYKYEIRIRFNELDRTVTDYDYSKTLRLMDLRQFILTSAGEIVDGK